MILLPRKEVRPLRNIEKVPYKLTKLFDFSTTRTYCSVLFILFINFLFYVNNHRIQLYTIKTAISMSVDVNIPV